MMSPQMCVNRFIIVVNLGAEFTRVQLVLSMGLFVPLKCSRKNRLDLNEFWPGPYFFVYVTIDFTFNLFFITNVLSQ